MTQRPEPVAWGDLHEGQTLPSFERETDFGHWNRYASVNDEFIDVHMDSKAAQAAGQPDVFGMGNLRIAYLHNAIHEWLGGAGDLVEFRCQFRQLNFKGDRLRTEVRVVGTEEQDGARLASLEFDVRNQADDSTTPGSARVQIFRDGKGEALPEPSPTPIPRDRAPGVHLDEETLSWLGRPQAEDVAYAVGTNDIRRWALATWWPAGAPEEFLDEASAARGPWGGLVAPRDFNPFAWTRCTPPDTYPWMRGMGTEPGTRGLNGGQRSLYFAPIQPGDVITSVVTLVDAFEKEGRLGTMLFLIDEARWTNQRGELVRLGQRTSIYY